MTKTEILEEINKAIDILLTADKECHKASLNALALLNELETKIIMDKITGE